ncbi:MAG: TIGR03118 family protein [Promicromonosporaceae bacterium]|nr:TIGR03118 family protein [Promicromonosporaceae bacterium]
MQPRRSAVGLALSVVLVGAFAGSASAVGLGSGRFDQVNLVSDQPGVAALTDPDLVNPWGMSHGPNTPVWVSNNGADVSTLYRTDTPGQPVTKVPTVRVDIPGGAPTGQVFNDTTAFALPTGGPARFIFAGEDGNLSAWNGGTSAVLVASTPNAVYKGIALVHAATGPELLMTNFRANRIDVFNASFQRVPTFGRFTDRFIPAGYAPFNVAEINGLVFVTYAKQDAARHDDVAGPGHGFIDVYSTSGRLLHRFATHGVLNSPWGMAVAPASFGRFAGSLLVGNFGDGRIHAFSLRTGAVLGVLRGASGSPLAIDGLWGLIVGDPVAGGTNALWFSAGPDGEAHGLLGLLEPMS